MKEILKKIDNDIKQFTILKEAHCKSGKEHLERICAGRIHEAKEIKEYLLTFQSKPLTIGDKLRESNDSLVKLILNFGYTCDHCSVKGNPSGCKKNGCAKGVTDYLNQPYREDQK